MQACAALIMCDHRLNLYFAVSGVLLDAGVASLVSARLIFLRLLNA